MSRHFGIFLFLCTFDIFVSGKSLQRLGGEGDWSSKYQPYTVAVKINKLYTCSGAIISPTKILTAASCVHDYINEAIPGSTFYENITVYAGSPSLSIGGSTYPVKMIRVSDDFKYGTFAHDIAVLTLATAIEYSDKRKPLGLPSKDVVNNSLGVASGWGTKSMSKLSDNLETFKRNIVTAAQCNAEYFKNFKVDVKVEFNDICGFYSTDAVGFCGGDGGSPMIQDGKVIGILAWGMMTDCRHTSRNIEVFTNVYTHLDFIKKELQ